MRVVDRIKSVLRVAITSGLLVGIILGAVGQLVRDRSAAWAILMYLPLVPLGVACLVMDAIRRGRGLPGPRFVLGGVGLVTALIASAPMVGWGSKPDPDPGAGSGREISVLHWNVLWGGGKGEASPSRWAAIRREIVHQEADLVILSEAPADVWLDQLVADLGPGASRVQVQHAAGARDWYKLVILSRRPMRLVRPVSLANGAGGLFEVELEGRTLRVLLVDGRSNPFRSRSPMLADVANTCRQAVDEGRPIDLLVGDFNSVSRSVGFDAIAERYDLASKASTGWRGTFPSFLPVYDIDHIWVNRDFTGLSDRLFTNFASDHRGQVARFRLLR